MITKCLQQSSTTDFSLEGVIVTHPDGDHIDGIIKLFERYPPNASVKYGSYRFVFDGPVLITEYFKKANSGKELIKLLTDSNNSAQFKEEAFSANPAQVPGFGTHFDFYFQNDSDSQGLVLKYSPPQQMLASQMLALKPIKPRYTIDDSIPNLSSIITTWSSKGKHVVVLSGDAPGYRVLEALSTKVQSGQIPDIGFFQIPHHGSARNSLPLNKNVLPNNVDIKIVNHMILFRIILGYSLKDEKGSLTSKEKQELLDQWVGTELMTKLQDKTDNNFKITMLDHLGPAVIKAINDNKKIHVPLDKLNVKSKGMYVFTQAVAGLEAVSRQVEEYIKNPSSHDIVRVFSTTHCKSLFKPNGKYLYTESIKCLNPHDLPETFLNEFIRYSIRVISELQRIDNPFLDQLMPTCVSKMYEQFHADIYYISSSTKHGHPSSATLSGVIIAAKRKNKACTLLLSSGYALPVRSLPHYTTWKDLVTIRYFTQPYAQVNPQSMKMVSTEVFNPTEYDPRKLNQLKQDLKSGAASKYFSSNLASNFRHTAAHYKVTVQQGGITYYLGLEEDENITQFKAAETEILLIASFQSSNLGTVCNFSDINLNLKKQTLMERSLINEYWFILYDLKEADGKQKKMYWKLPSSGAGRLKSNTRLSDAAAFTFQCGLKRKRDEFSLKFQSMLATHKHLLPKLSLLSTSTIPSNLAIHTVSPSRIGSMASVLTTDSETVTLQQYMDIVGANHSIKRITVQQLFDILLGNGITEQLKVLPGPPAVADVVTVILSLNVEETSTFTISSDQEEILSACVKVKLSDNPINLLNAHVKAIFFSISSPRTESLSLTMVVSWSFQGSEATFPLSKQLDLTIEGEVLSEFLKKIKFPADIKDVTFGDMAMLFTGSYFRGLASVTSLPLTLITAVAPWAVDNFKSEVKLIQLISGPFITDIVVSASIPSSDPSITFQNFMITVQELFLKYPSPNQTYQLSGKGLLNHQGSSPLQFSFSTEPSNDKNTAEITFQCETQVSFLSDFLSFLKLDSQLLEDVFIPFLSLALKALPLSTMGFSLKQGIQDSSDTYYINSLSFTVSLSTWNNWMPNGLRYIGENVNCTVLILQPGSTQPRVGFDTEFTALISSNPSKGIELPCKASILPVQASVEGETSGYTCFLKLSTALYNQQGQNIDLPRLTDIISAIGFGTQFKQLATAIPVIGSFLLEVSLKSFQITYNTKTKAITSIYLQVLVPKWNLFGQISLNDFELELQYSETGSWEANLQSDVILSEIYCVTIAFTLPTSSKPGGFSFHNRFEDLTVAKLFSLLGLPSLEEIPVLGNIFSITVKDVELGFEADGIALSLYGMKVEFYMDNIDMQVFRISDLNIVLAYNKSSDRIEISYGASGFINETIFVEVAYDPSKSEFKGHFEVTNRQTLSVNGAINVLLGKTSLSQNTAYSAVANQSSASVLLSLVYDSTHKSVSLQTFCISLQNIFDMKVGSLSLSHFSLEYTRDSNQPSLSQRILPSGSILELRAILLQKEGQVGLQLSFDCTISDNGSNSMSATIQPIPGKKLSLRSFLSLAGVNTPQLPESSSDSKPSPDGYLDLEVESGTITFQTVPTNVLKSFEVTTAFATNGWVILDDPKIELYNIRLKVSYDVDNGVKAKLYGSFIVGSLKITLYGEKGNGRSVFHIVVSKDLKFDNLMKIANDLSPSDRQGVSIPPDAGLPNSLEGSFTSFKLIFTPENQILDVAVSLDLKSWVLDLQFTTFTAERLGANLHWETEIEKQTESNRGTKPEPTTSKYSFKLNGHFSFDSIPVMIELDVGSTSDTIVQAKINNPSALQLSSIVDNTLDFAPAKSSSSPHFSDLLPQDTSPITFLSGYLQFNLTKKMFLLLGNVKDMGTCLLIAGSLKGTTDTGYAVTLTLPELSTLLSPLAPVESVLSVRNINASILNLGKLNIADLTKVVKFAESNLAHGDGQSPKSPLPFKNLSIPPDSTTAKIQINKGVSFYCELIFSENLSMSQLLKNIILIQPEDSRLPSVILFAQYSGNETVVQSIFLAKIPSMSLFGSLEFMDINFEFCSSTSGDVTSYTLSLSGNMVIPLISSVRFHGELRVLEHETTFRLVGDDQPTSIVAPLHMFGVSFKHPQLEVTYNYSKNNAFSSKFALRGQVDFFSTLEGPGDQIHSPSLTLSGECIWVDGSPSVISINLQTVDSPLTLTELVATIFDQAWDTDFLDIGLYDGKMYYSAKDVTVAGYHYMSGYHTICKTFIIKRSFVMQVDVSLPLDQTGFSISGSAIQPFNLGFAQLSTVQRDKKGNFKNLGPTMTYTHLRSHTKVSLGIGLTFLDVKVAAITIQYVPSNKAFIFTVTYPEKFLGIKPSISCAWSEENGFEITSWNLGSPDIPGFNGTLIRKIQEFANKPTAEGCAAIANFVVRQTVKTKFDIGMHTARKDTWNSDDLVAFKLTGKYSISLGGRVKIVSVPLPDITVHVPNPGNESRTMADVADYILHTLVLNAVSIAEQLLSNPKYLAEIFSALAFDQLVKQGSQYVIDSLVCRGLSREQVSNIGKEAAANEITEVESAAEEVGTSESAFAEAAAGGSLAAATLAAGDFVETLGVLGGFLVGMSGILSFFGLTSREYSDKNKQYDNARNELNSKMQELLTLTPPLHHAIQGDQLTLSWPPLKDQPSDLEYKITIDIISPVGGHISPITKKVTISEVTIQNRYVLLASSITVKGTASIKVKDHIFESKTPLSVTITHQATLPAPRSVIVQQNVSDLSLVGTINGIPIESQAVKADLVGIDSSGNTDCLSSTQKGRSSDSITFTFSKSVYAAFVGKGFKIMAQSLKSGLESSRFTSSDLILQISPPSNIQYSLPAFGDSNPLIHIGWTLPPDTTNVHGIVIQIINNNSPPKVVLSELLQKVDTHLPSNGTFPLAEFKKNINDEVPNKYTVRSCLTSNSTSIVSSGYCSSNKTFSVASPPSDVSASFVKSTDLFTIIWTPVDNISKYAVQMLKKESQVSILCHIVDMVDVHKKRQGTYSLSSRDMSKLTPGETFTVQVFSVGDTASVLSSFAANQFTKAILYMDVIKNASITYNVENDSINVKFDNIKQAEGYTMAVLQYHDNTPSVPTATIITKFTIPAEETNKPVNYSLSLTEFRDDLSDDESCGFEVRTFGSTSDIPSPYVRLDKTWKTVKKPSNVTYTYSPSANQLTLTCHPVTSFVSYKLMVKNEEDGVLFVKSSSTKLPTAQWSGTEIKGTGGNQFVCIAQTIGTADLFNSKLTKSTTKLTRLDSLSAPVVDYTSDVSSMKLRYPLVNNSQSYYFKLDLRHGENDRTLHIIDSFKPSLSDKEVIITFNLSEVSISPGTSLVVTACAKGGGKYINSNESQFSSGTIQCLNQPQNLQTTYDNRNQTLSIKWNKVLSSSFYSIDCIDSQTMKRIYNKSDIKSADVQIQTSELIAHGVITVSVSITAHSGGGSVPYLPSKSKSEDVSVDKLIESQNVRRMNVATAVAEWIVTNSWKSRAQNIEMLVVAKSKAGEKREAVSTGEKESIYISGLTSEQDYMVSFISGLSSNPIVIGIPLYSSIPGKDYCLGFAQDI